MPQRYPCPGCGGSGAIRKEKVRIETDPKTGKTRTVTEPVYEVCTQCGGSGQRTAALSVVALRPADPSRRQSAGTPQPRYLGRYPWDNRTDPTHR